MIRHLSLLYSFTTAGGAAELQLNKSGVCVLVLMSVGDATDSQTNSSVFRHYKEIFFMVTNISAVVRITTDRQ